MAQVLIRQLEDEVVERLKLRAQRAGRSLEAELREILKDAVSEPMEELHRIREAFGGKRLPDSSELLRDR